MKAKQVQAQFEAQQAKPVRHFTKRRMLAGLSAAAAVLICGAVTAGAAGYLDYSTLFSRYFTEKSGGQVVYDYTGMGIDIGETVVGEGFTLTVQSVLADASAVYVISDITLDADIQEMIAPYDDVQVSGGVFACVEKEGENGTYTPSGRTFNAVPLGDGVYRSMSTQEMDFGTDLSDKQIRIYTPEHICIGYNYADGVDTDPLVLACPQEQLVYDLADIAVQPGLCAAYGGTLPNDANSNIFDEMTVTPFMLRFTHEDTVSSVGTEPRWGYIPGIDEVEVVFTAVYADGTEQVIPYDPFNSGGTSSRASSNGNGYDTLLSYERYFSAPIPLDGLTAIRVNDIEIPVQ